MHPVYYATPPHSPIPGAETSEESATKSLPVNVAMNMQTPAAVVQSVIPCPVRRVVIGSYLGPKTILNDGFRGFPQSIHVNSWTKPPVWARQFPSTAFCYSLTIIQLDTVQNERFKTPYNYSVATLCTAWNAKGQAPAALTLRKHPSYPLNMRMSRPQRLSGRQAFSDSSSVPPSNAVSTPNGYAAPMSFNTP